jgi:hypothetical protein
VVKEVPDAVITDVDPALVQFRQQFAAGEIRLLRDAGTYPCLFVGEREGASCRPSATPPDCRSRPRVWSSGSPMSGSPDNAPPPASGSCRRQRRRQRVRADRESTEPPCGLASIPARILNRTFGRAGISHREKSGRGVIYWLAARVPTGPARTMAPPGSAEST